MTKRQNANSKSLFVRILIAVCVFAFALSAMFIVIENTKADSKLEIAPEYFVGETFEIPSSTVTVGSSEVDATAVMYYPSGKATTAKKVTFDEYGKYILEYRAEVDGKLHTETYDIIVNQKAYDGGLNASAYYSQEDEGLIANFAAGGVLKFNKRFDLSELTSSDNLIKVLPLPTEKGTADCLTLVFTFTDVHDPENFINVRFYAQDGVGGVYALAISNSYVAVSYPGAPYTGIDGGGNIHKGNNYGRPIRMSFYGVPAHEVSPGSATKIDKDYGLVHFDYAGRTISASSNIASYGGLVADFDNKSFFANTWKGFTTGEVFVSVKMENLSSSATSASFLIKELAGKKLTSETSVTDTIAPSITVDYGAYTEDTVPYGVKNQAYNIFSATASDNIDFYPEIKASVYKNYFTPAIRKSYALTNGTFTPDSAGSYVIEYKATDVYGNVATKAVAVNVTDQPQDITIIAESILDAVQGSEVIVPTATVNADSRFGQVELDSKLYFGNTEIKVVNGRFIPLNSGEYKVVYTAKDFAGTVKTLEKTFSVALNEGSVFLDDVAELLPKYFIEGNAYTLPRLDAYIFSTSGYEKVESSIKINGETLNGYEFIPEVENDGQKITVTYFHNELEVSYEIETINALYKDEYENVCVDLTKYFIADEKTTVTATEDKVALSFTDETSKVNFANALYMRGYSMFFSVDENKNNFNKIIYTLTDSVNPEKQVNISFTKGSAQYVALSVNDNPAEEVNGSFNGREISFEIIDSNIIKMTKTTNNSRSTIMYDIKTFTDGTAFTGFTNDMAYLTIQIAGMSGESTLNVLSINNNYFSNSAFDPASPKVQFYGELLYEQDKGAIVEIPAARGIDVVQGVLPVTVSIRFNGKYVKDVNGKLMNKVDASITYQVEFSEYGEYTVIYESYDMVSNKGGTSRKVKVFDNVPPTITLSGTISETQSLGEIKLPSATATDNLGGEFKVYVSVINPKASSKFVKDYTFTAEIAGKYIVRYFAYDASGNLGYAEYVINVK